MRSARRVRSGSEWSDAEQRLAGDRYRALGDRELLMAMRSGESAAFDEFVARFHPILLHYARLARVPSEAREELVIELLGDAASRFVSAEHPLPGSVAAYLVTALRHRALNMRRDRARRMQRCDDALDTVGAPGEWAVVSLCSEATVRASRSPDWDTPSMSPALVGLAAALDQKLSDDERRLLGWLAHYIPQRQIATWLGISHAAVAKRVERLRARLRVDAERYVAEQSPVEQSELHRFFQRVAHQESDHD